MEEPDNNQRLESVMAELKALRTEVVELKDRVSTLEAEREKLLEGSLSHAPVAEHTAKLLDDATDPDQASESSSAVLGINPSSYPSLSEAREALTAKIVEIWNTRSHNSSFWSKDQIAQLQEAGLIQAVHDDSIQMEGSTVTGRTRGWVLIAFPNAFLDSDPVGLLLPMGGLKDDWLDLYDVDSRDIGHGMSFERIRSACVVQINDGDAYTLLTKGAIV